MDDTVKFWNNGAIETYGFLREEALGKPIHELLQTESAVPLEQIMNQMAQTGRWEGELIHTTSSGKEIIVESRWALQTDKDGMPVGALEINREITARKRAEEALKTNVSRLELINQELQDFAFVAAHDLQEPLRKIQTFCDMAMRRCSQTLDEEAGAHLARVLTSAGRMRQQLRDLLEFSRVAARPEPFKKVDFAKVARDAVDVFEASIKDSGCRIEIGHLPVIDADESQILRLFQNLVGNALKFRSGDAPGIKIYCKPETRGMCEIFVEDNGIGFDRQFAELIFKPFQRLHGKGEYDGTGMGLAICRKIVERHGGAIRAESKPGEGATFIVRLPVKQPGPGAA